MGLDGGMRGSPGRTRRRHSDIECAVLPTGIPDMRLGVLPDMRAHLCAVMSILIGLASGAQADETTLRVGFREDAPPFSAQTESGALTGGTVQAAYEGFSVDICHRIVDSYLEGHPDLKVVVFGFTAPKREEMMEAREPTFDILCDSTSMTRARLSSCAFSFPYFVTGITYATAKSDTGVELKTLAEAKVGLVGGTTAVNRLNTMWQNDFGVDPQATLYEDYATGLAAIEAGEVKAVFGDQILLQGAVMENEEKFGVAKDIYSVELYGVCINPARQDLLLTTNQTLGSLYASNEIYAILGDHFGGRGASRILTNVYRMFALPEE
ncbi:transporter substrate-binding domain-containing protein [Roseovarius sp. M141]|uniref:transporter substrate-binding domain-containing protein n=1 Tax=Roseovarius sp. M141 TaxID=2583806 RepID=UPI0020CD004F|nr:transporter substrate-binding domain-containing protein [Roseovarius sp. M141]